MSLFLIGSKNVFDVFHEFDPSGTSFRYGGDISGGEVLLAYGITNLDG